MQSTTTRKLIAATLAASLTSFAVLSFAQTASAPSPELRAQHMAQRADQQATPPSERQAKMQQRHAERQAALKTALGITAEQEPAWNAYVTRTGPESKGKGERHAKREDMAKLTTPERLDKMQAHQAERAAAMTRRIDATRSLYSALTPEQQKRFDTQAHFQRAGMHGKHRGAHHESMGPRS